MQTLPSSAVLTLLLANTVAQSSVDVQTVTPVGAAIGTGAGFTSLASLPANTIVAQPVLLAPQLIALIHSVRLEIGFPTAPHPTFTVDSRLALGFAFPPLTGLVGGTTAATTPAGTPLGPVEMLGRFHALPGTTGRIEVSWAQFLSTTASSVVNTAAIDVGADGSVEVSSPTGPIPVPVVVGATGTLQVRVTIANHHASVPNVTSTSLVTVRFVRDPVCSITPFGTPCGAISAGNQAVAGPVRTITLLLAGGFPSSLVASVFGAQNSGPTLPGGCALLCDASIVMLLVADALGQAQHQVAIPTAALGTLYHQFLPVDLAAGTFRASNGLDITCTP